MPLTHTQKSEIREKWNDINNDFLYTTATESDLVADFWLSILDEQLDKKVEEVKETIWKWCEKNRFEIHESGFGKMDVVDCDGLGELFNKLKT